MSNGLLGKVLSNSAQAVTGYTAPSNLDFATVTASLVNTGPDDATVKMAITTSASPGLEDYIEFDAVIPSNGGTLERTCMLMSANEKLVLESNKSTVVMRVTGLEQLLAGV